jgi:hypothetical protein
VDPKPSVPSASDVLPEELRLDEVEFDRDEPVLMREVAALKADDELGAWKPVELELPCPALFPETAEADEVTVGPSVPDELALDELLESLRFPLPDRPDAYDGTVVLPAIDAFCVCVLARFRSLRLARSCGVIRVTNFSAAVTPVMRIVRSRVPDRTAAVRIADRTATSSFSAT